MQDLPVRMAALSLIQTPCEYGSSSAGGVIQSDPHSIRGPSTNCTWTTSPGLNQLSHSFPAYIIPAVYEGV